MQNCKFPELSNNINYRKYHEAIDNNTFLQSPYPKNYKPDVLIKDLETGSTMIRIDNLYDAFFYDYPTNTQYHSTGYRFGYTSLDALEKYFKERIIVTEKKQKIIQQVKRNLELDKSFLELIHRAKSEKRSYDKNKFCGNLSIVDYAKQNDKMFSKQIPGKKKQTLNLAFQVGTFLGGNYAESFTRILKTVLMCQALNIHLNIDMFDSDTDRCGGDEGYIIINVAKSYKKLNYAELLCAMHQEFFDYTLFNGYLAVNKNSHSGGFLSESRIIKDLSPYYDIIGGNMLNEGVENDEMISSILKISNILDLDN